MKHGNKGFTLIELLVVIAIIAITAAIAVPGFISYMPRMRLKSLSRDILSDMQYARVQAIRSNAAWQLKFDTGAPGYEVLDNDLNVVKTVYLADYKGIDFGSNNTNVPAAGFTDPPPTDGIDYTGGAVPFRSNGTAEAGVVYLKNGKGDSMAVGTSSAAGRVKAWYDFGGGWKE